MNSEPLKKLHTALLDAQEGYKTAIEKAETPESKTLFTEMLQLHSSAHADVHQALNEQGEKAEESGSFMGTVHKAAITVRSAVTGLDKGLSAFAEGEERLLEVYEDALQTQGENTQRILRQHRDRLVKMVGRVKELATTAEAR